MIKFLLEKCSNPGWVKEFDDPSSRIDELRSHICRTCLWGDPDDEYYQYEPPIDVTVHGITYQCRDIHALLGTPCGLEYEAREHYEGFEQEDDGY